MVGNAHRLQGQPLWINERAVPFSRLGLRTDEFSGVDSLKGCGRSSLEASHVFVEGGPDHALLLSNEDGTGTARVAENWPLQVPASPETASLTQIHGVFLLPGSGLHMLTDALTIVSPMVAVAAPVQWFFA